MLKKKKEKKEWKKWWLNVHLFTHCGTVQYNNFAWV
jgi:hypothetical protein